MCLFQAWCPPLTSTSGVSQDLLPSRSLESPTHLCPPTVTLLHKHFMVGISSWICIKLYWVIVLCVSVLCYNFMEEGRPGKNLPSAPEGGSWVAVEQRAETGQLLLKFSPQKAEAEPFQANLGFFILSGWNFGCIFLEVEEVSLSFQHSPWERPGKWLEPSLEWQNWIVGK